MWMRLDVVGRVVNNVLGRGEDEGFMLAHASVSDFSFLIWSTTEESKVLRCGCKGMAMPQQAQKRNARKALTSSGGM